MRGTMVLRIFCVLLSGASVAVAAVPAAAQGSYSPYNETPSAALARYIRALVDDPKDFDALIGAGRAALELGDAQAAAGFFARADDVNPRSPLPQAGMGAVSVANGEPKAALPYFHRAQQLGASVGARLRPRSRLRPSRSAGTGAVGLPARLTGPDREEASRRLALSLAISGNRAAALQTLSPLTATRDAGAARARAFVLALTGDSAAAMAVIDNAMPGSSSRVAPFLQRLPSLKPGQKAAAVNLGIFPDSTAAAYASASAARPTSAPVSAAVDDDHRLDGIEDFARWKSHAAAARACPHRLCVGAKAGRAATASGFGAATAPQDLAPTCKRAQCRSAARQVREHETLSRRFVRRSSSLCRDRTLIAPGWSSDRSRTPPMPSCEARSASGNINAFRWSNSETDRIVPIDDE